MSAEYQVEISKTVSIVALDEEAAIKYAVSQMRRDIIQNAPAFFIDSFDFAVTGAQNMDPEHPEHSDGCEKCADVDAAGED